MIKAILVIIIVLHGMIHLLGFFKEWNVVQLTQLSGETIFLVSAGISKLLGILWIIACLVFLFSATSLILNKDWWWKLALIGVIVSQTLIIIYWRDARGGTVSNLVIIATLIMVINNYHFIAPTGPTEKKIQTSEKG